jgi:hypothetical protein
MDPETAITILGKIIAENDAQKQKEQMQQLLSDVNNLHSLVLGLKDVIRAAIIEDDLNYANSSIVQAQAHYYANNFPEAHSLAQQALTKLMQGNVEVEGTTSFLAAAALDVACLQRMAAAPPPGRNAAEAAAELKQLAGIYGDHAGSLSVKVKGPIAERITVENPSINTLRYKVDGVQTGLAGNNAEGQQFFGNKKAWDIMRLGAPILYRLMIAAETWHAILAGTVPVYGPLFDGCIITSDDGANAWSLIVNGRRIDFQSAMIKDYSVVFGTVPIGVFNLIDRTGAILQGAKAWRTGDRSIPWSIEIASPGAGVGLQPGKTPVANVDTQQPVLNNGSFFQEIDAVSYKATYQVIAELHAYQFPDGVHHP